MIYSIEFITHSLSFEKYFLYVINFDFSVFDFYEFTNKNDITTAILTFLCEMYEIYEICFEMTNLNS